MPRRLGVPEYIVQTSPHSSIYTLPVPTGKAYMLQSRAPLKELSIGFCVQWSPYVGIDSSAVSLCLILRTFANSKAAVDAYQELKQVPEHGAVARSCSARNGSKVLSINFETRRNFRSRENAGEHATRRSRKIGGILGRFCIACYTATNPTSVIQEALPLSLATNYYVQRYF